MPYNGSGTAGAPAGGNYPAVASTLIESGKFNILIADLLTMLSTALLKDGQQVATARIPFASGIQTDSITENTSNTGVTLDSVLLKDGRVDTTQGADIASAATLNLETATGNVVDVTGTVTVTAVTLSQGHWRLARFTGALVLTNSASLVLPGAANYTTTAGDYVLFAGYAAGVVRANVFPTSGSAVMTAPFTDTTEIVKGSADATKKIRFEVDGLTTATTRVLTPPDRNLTLRDAAVLATEQASTSGTSIDFTGIPTWATKIIIQFVGVSTSGISPLLVQLGDSGGIETSGYLASAARIATANVTETSSSTAGFPLVAMAATGVFHGQITLTLENATTFTWVCSGMGAKTDVIETMMVGGRKSTSAVLDRVRITTANGTDTFDAGAINILYE